MASIATVYGKIPLAGVLSCNQKYSNHCCGENSLQRFMEKYHLQEFSPATRNIPTVAVEKSLQRFMEKYHLQEFSPATRNIPTVAAEKFLATERC